MAINNPMTRENLKYNYGVVFTKVLKLYGQLVKFYDNEIPIKKNKWYSVCEGRVYFSEVDKLYEKTRIDKEILNGVKKINISTIAEKDRLEDLDEIITLLKNNPKEFEENRKNGDYDKEFLKLVDYVFSITNKTNNIEGKFNDVIKSLEIITSKDYINVDNNVLEKYQKALKEHLDIAIAAIIVKKF